MDLQNKAIELSGELDWDVYDALQLCLYILEDCNLHTAYGILDDYRNDLLSKHDEGGLEVLSDESYERNPLSKVQDYAAKQAKAEHERKLPAIKKRSAMLSKALMGLGIIENPLPLEQDTYTLEQLEIVFYVRFQGQDYGNGYHALAIRHTSSREDDFYQGHHDIGGFEPDKNWLIESQRLLEAIKLVQKWATKKEIICVNKSSEEGKLLDLLRQLNQMTDKPF